MNVCVKRVDLNVAFGFYRFGFKTDELSGGRVSVSLSSKAESRERVEICPVPMVAQPCPTMDIIKMI